MPRDQTLNVYLTVRVNRRTLTAVQRRASKAGMSASDLVRDLIEALLDDRLTVLPDPRKEPAYVTRN